MLLSVKEGVERALAQLLVKAKKVTSLPKVEELRAFMSKTSKGENSRHLTMIS